MCRVGVVGRAQEGCGEVAGLAGVEAQLKVTVGGNADLDVGPFQVGGVGADPLLVRSITNSPSVSRTDVEIDGLGRTAINRRGASMR